MATATQLPMPRAVFSGRSQLAPRFSATFSGEVIYGALQRYALSFGHIRRRGRVNPQYPCGLYKTYALPIEDNHPIRLPVRALRPIGGPPAIFWRIGTVVVNAVDCHSWRTFPHIGEEVHEGTPAVAYSYATIPVVLGITFAASSTEHSLPRPICRGSRQSMRSSRFLPSVGRHHFFQKTSARRRIGASHGTQKDIADSPALANSLEITLSLSRGRGPSVQFAQYSQASELCPYRDINPSGHYHHFPTGR